MPTARDRGVDLGVGARHRRIDAEQRDVHVLGAEPLADQLDARERRRSDHEVGVPAGDGQAAPVEADAAPGRDVRDPQERDVVHGHDERASRTGGTARLGACTTSASRSHGGPPEPVPHS